MKVWEGDEWKRAADSPTDPTKRTRAQEQEFIDTEYANGRMGLAQWRDKTNELSEPTKWITAGKI